MTAFEKFFIILASPSPFELAYLLLLLISAPIADMCTSFFTPSSLAILETKSAPLC